MMKGMINPCYQAINEENMSNLTSASGEASTVSSSHQQASFASPVIKKKRNLPGNPDPEAEVIALSPKTLMATNRFVCEICSKGFQRDQNLQLHRRGHNLPWKLKTRATGKEATRKKVYVCPEPACVHHDASRALGDLTGIKKHYSRKHGEKRWKCDKCSKKYAVQSDWKAHSKICGTREYRCDCGTLFSRKDSFITHRAFCDALAEESKKAITDNPLLFPPPISASAPPPALDPTAHFPPNLLSSNLPPWLDQGYAHDCVAPAPATAPAPSSAHMSATALLQKAAMMGATLSKPPHHGQMASTSSTTSGFGIGNGGGDDGMTRDFLGLQRQFTSHREILSMAGLDHCMSYEQLQQQSNKKQRS